MSKISTLLSTAAFLGFVATGLTAASAADRTMVDASIVTGSVSTGTELGMNDRDRTSDRYSNDEIIVLGR